MIEKICIFCSQPFLVHRYREKTAHFCSTGCYNVNRKKLAYQPKICSFCKKEFIPNRSTRGCKYCTKECNILGRRKYRTKNEKVKWDNKEGGILSQWRGEKICVYCGKKFSYTTKQIHQKYCDVRCQVKSRSYKIDEKFFDKINSEGKAYLLGLIFSDGSLTSKKYYINITSKDKELIRLCRGLLQTDRPIYHYHGCFSLTIGNQHLHGSLKRQGVLERKSWKEYGLPSLSESLMRHFLRGIFDGDGSFYISNHGKWKYLCASFSCGSQQFLKEVKEWLEKHGVKSHTIRFDKKPNNKGCWQLKIARKDAVKKFTNCLYRNNHYFLNRKYKIVKSFYEQYI